MMFFWLQQHNGTLTWHRDRRSLLNFLISAHSWLKKFYPIAGRYFNLLFVDKNYVVNSNIVIYENRTKIYLSLVFNLIRMKFISLLILCTTLSHYVMAQDDTKTIVLDLLTELNNAKHDTAKVAVLNKLANEFIGVDNDKALEYAKQACLMAQKAEYSLGKIQAYYNIAKSFYYQYQFDSVLFYFEKSKEIISLEENWQIEANFESLIGLVFHIQSNYSEAIKHYTQSLNLNEKQHDKEGMAYCYNDIGAAFYNLGNFEKALENYFKSLKINEEIANSFMVAKNLMNIGGIYQEQEKYNSALEYYLKANAMATKIGAKQTIADTYRNIGGIYSEEQKYDSTLLVYEKALEIYKELNDLRGLVVLYNKFGEAYSDQNFENNQTLFNKAYEYYEKSLEINNREIEEIEEQIVSYMGIGKIYIFTKRYSEAIPYLNKALKMSEEIESITNIKNTNEYLSQAYAGLGNYRRAYESHVLFKNWNDSLKNDENIELLTQTSMQYEFDKQQKEQEFIQAQKDLEYQQKQKRDKLIRFFILTGFIIVSIFSVQMYRSFQRKKRDNILLEKQKEEIEKQKEEITGSIRYAKRIQTAILPSNQWAKENLPEHFILFRPRDIVSGDYYWMNKIGNKVILAAADCTGHGVPGAFMSMLGVSFLNEIVNKNNTIEPHLILNQLRSQVKHTLDQTGKEGEAKDGMDIAVCVVDFDTLELQYAGAYNPMYLFRNGEIIETKADKMPIGIYIREKESFTNNEIQLQKGDTFYIFSDGFADQFGGPKGGKLKSGPFKELLSGIQDKSMADQREFLNTFIDDWIGEYDQIDDMIILGIRV